MAKNKPAMAFKEKRPKSMIALTIILFTLGLCFIFPFIFMLSSSFKLSGDITGWPMSIIPQNPTIHNYSTVLDNPSYNFGQWYRNTIIYTGLVIVLKSFIVTLTAYAFAKIPFKGRSVVFLVLLSSLMIPGDIMIIPRYIEFTSMGIIDSVWALALPAAFDVYYVFLVRQFFVGIPYEITEAAEIDGCGRFRTYWRIVLPLGLPAVITMILFTFVGTWNDYLGPYIFINSIEKQMLSVGIQMFTVGSRQDVGAQMAAATLILIPVIAMFLFTQKYFVQNISVSAVKG